MSLDLTKAISDHKLIREIYSIMATGINPPPLNLDQLNSTNKYVKEIYRLQSGGQEFSVLDFNAGNSTIKYLREIYRLMAKDIIPPPLDINAALSCNKLLKEIYRMIAGENAALDINSSHSINKYLKAIYQLLANGNPSENFLIGAYTSEDGNYVLINTDKNIMLPAKDDIVIKEDGVPVSILSIEIYNEKSIKVIMSNALLPGSDLSLTLLNSIDIIEDGEIAPVLDYPIDNLIVQHLSFLQIVDVKLSELGDYIDIIFNEAFLFEYTDTTGFDITSSLGIYIEGFSIIEDNILRLNIGCENLLFYTDIFTLSYTQKKGIIVTNEEGVELAAFSELSIENTLWEPLGITPIESDYAMVSVIDNPIAQYFITPASRNPYIEIVQSNTGSFLPGRGVQIIGDGNILDVNDSDFVNQAGDIFRCTVDQTNGEFIKFVIEIIPFDENTLVDLDSNGIYVTATHGTDQAIGLITLTI